MALMKIRKFWLEIYNCSCCMFFDPNFTFKLQVAYKHQWMPEFCVIIKILLNLFVVIVLDGYILFYGVFVLICFYFMFYLLVRCLECFSYKEKTVLLIY
ncbi:hypothetical protein F896_01527 [Acinetobacter genomosp. 15BJ]|uniref:Uncharacterized protein n=1 Tax=Acinetobacter genomosp. 15BJ TaxID=106651 RepID=R9B3G8_9GAMM|nr:hypothetical protein F896_01527 [Acinetobacter genomosp. 15BJ]